MPANTKPAPADGALELLADFRVTAKRAPIYAAGKDAKRAPVPTVSDVAYVTRGAHTKTGAPVLMVVDGSTISALALPAIGAAVAGGVISRAEIAALLGE